MRTVLAEMEQGLPGVHKPHEQSLWLGLIAISTKWLEGIVRSGAACTSDHDRNQVGDKQEGKVQDRIDQLEHKVPRGGGEKRNTVGKREAEHMNDGLHTMEGANNDHQCLDEVQQNLDLW